MEKGFWQHFKKPIIGLAPMDGVTDAPFRFITAKYGKPDLQITEFTSVEGICAGATKTLNAFRFDESERPIVAQVFGSDENAFYKAAFVVFELGFDGIDINMGCPAKNITSKKAGAGLILEPKLAQKITQKTWEASQDWANGKTIEKVGLPENIVEWVKKFQQEQINKSSEKYSLARKIIPVSIKTRIGYDKIIVEDWIKYLLEMKPANISLHGRTLKQMYSGEANWEAITKAARLVHQTETIIFGNGDIKNLQDADEKIKNCGVDGVLIGRAALGNPWIFRKQTTLSPYQPTLQEKFAVAIEHASFHQQIFGEKLFFPMRKHLSWYCRGFANASETRQKLMTACNAEDVREILS